MMLVMNVIFVLNVGKPRSITKDIKLQEYVENLNSSIEFVTLDTYRDNETGILGFTLDRDYDSTPTSVTYPDPKQIEILQDVCKQLNINFDPKLYFGLVVS